MRFRCWSAGRTARTCRASPARSRCPKRFEQGRDAALRCTPCAACRRRSRSEADRRRAGGSGGAATLKIGLVGPLLWRLRLEKGGSREVCMLGRTVAVVLVFSWLPDCKGEGEPGGSVKKFVL